MSTLAERANGTADRTPVGPTLADQIKSMESQFALAMPKGAEAAQLVRDAITAVRTTPKLAECQPATVLGGLMTFAQLGLRPGVLGHGWLLPYWDSKSRTNKAQVVLGYQGLVELAHRSGRIQSLIARVVYANDGFDIDYGLADSLVHKPNLSGTRGEPIGYYAIAKFKDGGHSFIYLTQTEVEQYRDNHASAKTKEGRVVGPWRDHFEAMALKTCVRQLAKWLPKATDLANAIEVDGAVRVDLTPTVEPMTVSHHYADGDVIEGEVVDVDPETGEIK